MNKEFGAFVTQDQSKCSGCKACELACFAAHRMEPGKTVGNIACPVVPKLFVTEHEYGCAPVQCKHCEDAPCLNACKRDAILRIDHQVIINTQKCECCSDPVCATACPFGAIRLLPLPAKCDLCIGEEKPACVEACPNKALRLVQLTNEISAKHDDVLRLIKYMG